MAITQLPPAPSRQDPANFSMAADAFLGALPDFATEANQLATEAEQDAVTATTQAGIATTQAGIATTQAGIATAQAVLASGFVDDAAAAAGASKWVSGTNYTQGTAVYSPIDYKTYRTNSSGISTIDPKLEPARWVALVKESQIKRVTRSSNTKLTSFDNGNLIDITSGTFTQTFDACATLGDGWFCYIRNGGTGDITLDPNASEQIDGLTSYIMYPGEVRLVQCDGTALRSVVLNAFYKVFTVSGTFTKPPGYSVFAGRLWGGGGSGAKSGSSSTNVTGGGGGAYAEFTVVSAEISAPVTVTVGSGGVAQTVSGNGNTGGTTSFLSYQAMGGSGGSSTGYTASGGSSIIAMDPNTNQILSPSNATGNALGSLWGGGGSSRAEGANYGRSLFGGTGGGSIDSSNTIFVMASSTFGGSGGAASTSGSGTVGQVLGGGGGATQTGASSGAGGRGELRIWGVI